MLKVHGQVLPLAWSIGGRKASFGTRYLTSIDLSINFESTLTKLFQYIAIAAKASDASEWIQSSNQEAMEMYRTRSEKQWGHLVGFRAAAEWNLCPELVLP